MEPLSPCLMNAELPLLLVNKHMSEKICVIPKDEEIHINAKSATDSNEEIPMSLLNIGGQFIIRFDAGDTPRVQTSESIKSGNVTYQAGN